jgi:hypothetical protein
MQLHQITAYLFQEQLCFVKHSISSTPYIFLSNANLVINMEFSYSKKHLVAFQAEKNVSAKTQILEHLVKPN